MLSVTKRVNSAQQPPKGYAPISLFSIQSYDDLYEVKDVNVTLAAIQGLAVDYLTRFFLSGDRLKAFDISIRGALRIDEAYENDKEYRSVMKLISGIRGLDKQSVINACKAVCYDSAFRAGVGKYRSSDDVEYTEDLYRNIPILVKRCLVFFKEKRARCFGRIWF